MSTTELPKKYEHFNIENKWYQHWLNKKYFNSFPDKDKKPYTIVIPPPNVTGVLHMGHMLNNTIQDVLIRRARMKGYNACWVPGTDHASIATEAKVVKMLAEKGIKKSELTREEFLKYAWEWKEKYGGIILEQLKKLGASCDWNRTTFTMDEAYSDAVLNAFIDLYNKGYIYRGYRMINWDPIGKTALSDEEVIYKESNSQLVYVKYFLEDKKNYIVIATTRPETIMADVAVCVHPDDERYKHLIGKKVIVPIVNRLVPVIADAYIDPTFGTGALKVTPAHDTADYELGIKHQLPIIIGLTPDGKISKDIITNDNEKGAEKYVGLDRFVCRKQIISDLQGAGLIEKIEIIKNKVGHSERTDAVIEPYLSHQWFVKMKDISKPALDAVLNKKVNLIPDKFVNTYKHWMENVKDWCISRQLWWGHRIPAWYNENGDIAVCKTKEEAIEIFKKNNQSTNGIHQDEDVLDTWFSSWLWPIAVFDPKVVGNDDYTTPNEDFKYYYPTNDLVTAPEILFFWVARMIIAGYLWGKGKPFTNVYLTGIVRDKLGRKMSKSLGNSPDPLDLIEKYGADGVRVGMMFSSPAGNDLLFDEEYCIQGRNFANKIWNAFRLIHQLSERKDDHLPATTYQTEAIELFENYFYKQLEYINDCFDKFRLNDALMTTYKLIWDDFCSWYLEAIKPNNFSDKISFDVINKSVELFENCLKILHPWMPFITEEIWHLLKERQDGNDIIISAWPQEKKYNPEIIKNYEMLKEIVTQIREIRSKHQISPKQKLVWKEAKAEKYDQWIEKLCNLNRKKITTDTNGKIIVYGKRTIYIELNYDPRVENLRSMLLENKQILSYFIDYRNLIDKLEELLYEIKIKINTNELNENSNTIKLSIIKLYSLKEIDLQKIDLNADKSKNGLSKKYLNELKNIERKLKSFFSNDFFKEKKVEMFFSNKDIISQLYQSDLSDLNDINNIKNEINNYEKILNQIIPKYILMPYKKHLPDLKNLNQNINIETNIQIQKLEDELNYLNGFLESVRKKLSNEKFLQNAKPELVEKEKQKERDALQKINTIKEELERLKEKAK